MGGGGRQPPPAGGLAPPRALLLLRLLLACQLPAFARRYTEGLLQLLDWPVLSLQQAEQLVSTKMKGGCACETEVRRGTGWALRLRLRLRQLLRPRPACAPARFASICRPRYGGGNPRSGAEALSGARRLPQVLECIANVPSKRLGLLHLVDFKGRRPAAAAACLAGPGGRGRFGKGSRAAAAPSQPIWSRLTACHSAHLCLQPCTR